MGLYRDALQARLTNRMDVLLAIFLCLFAVSSAGNITSCPSLPRNATSFALSASECKHEWLCDDGFTEDNGQCVRCPLCSSDEYGQCGYERKWLPSTDKTCSDSVCRDVCGMAAGMVYTGRCSGWPAADLLPAGKISTSESVCMCVNSSRPHVGSCVVPPLYNERPCDASSYFSLVGYFAIEGHQLTNAAERGADTKVDFTFCESVCSSESQCRCFALYGGVCYTGSSKEQCLLRSSISTASDSKAAETPPPLAETFVFFKVGECINCTGISCSCLRGDVQLPRLGCFREDRSMAVFRMDAFPPSSSARTDCPSYASSLGHSFFCQSPWDCFTAPGEFPVHRLSPVPEPWCTSAQAEGYQDPVLWQGIMRCNEIRSTCVCPPGTFLSSDSLFSRGCQNTATFWLVAFVAPALSILWAAWCVCCLRFRFSFDSRSEFHCCSCGVRMLTRKKCDASRGVQEVVPLLLEDMPCRVQPVAGSGQMCEAETPIFFPDTIFPPDQVGCQQRACFQYSDNGRLLCVCAEHERELLSLAPYEDVDVLHAACRQPESVQKSTIQRLSMCMLFFGPMYVCQFSVLVIAIQAASSEGLGYTKAPDGKYFYDLVTAIGVIGWLLFAASVMIIICTSFLCRDSGLLPFIKQRNLMPTPEQVAEMKKGGILALFRFGCYLAGCALVLKRTRRAANMKSFTCCWCSRNREAQHATDGMDEGDVELADRRAREWIGSPDSSVCNGCIVRAGAVQMLPWPFDNAGKRRGWANHVSPSISPEGLSYPIRVSVCVNVEVSAAIQPSLSRRGHPAPHFEVVCGELPSGLFVDHTTGRLVGNPSCNDVNGVPTASSPYSDVAPLLAGASEDEVVAAHTITVAAFNCAGECRTDFTVEVYGRPALSSGLTCEASEERSVPRGLAMLESVSVFEPSVKTATEIQHYKLEIGKRCKDIEAGCDLGSPFVTWTVQPLLPLGLHLNPRDGRISGTPLIQTLSGAGVFTLIAVNAPRHPPSQFCIKVGPEVEIQSVTYPGNLVEGSFPDEVCVVGESITWTPTVDPLSNLAEFWIADRLPEGLSINPLSGEIYGIPAGPSKGKSYRVVCESSKGKQLWLKLYFAVSDKVDTALACPSQLWSSEQLQVWLRHRGGTDQHLWMFLRHLDVATLWHQAQDAELSNPLGVTQAMVEFKVRMNPLAQLNEYTVMQKLGEGGQGSVWKAVRKATGEVCAIKIRPGGDQALPGEDTDATPRQREDVNKIVKREARNLARLTRLGGHKNVVKLIDFDESVPCLVMEIVQGDTLDQYRRKRPKGILKWEECAPIMAQFLEGLAYMHRMHVLHRDLKPQNIMVEDTGFTLGAEPRVVIVDLGLAKRSNWGETYTQSRQEQFLQGTARYFSPEQANFIAPQALTEMVDTWAAGMIMYELLSGRTPFDVGLHDEPADPRWLPDAIRQYSAENRSFQPPVGVPDAVEKFLLAALRSYKAMRFRSGVYMCAVFKDVCKDPNTVPLELSHRAHEHPRLTHTVMAFPCKAGTDVSVQEEMTQVDGVLRASGGNIVLEQSKLLEKREFLECMRTLDNNCTALHFAGHGTSRRGGSFVWEDPVQGDQQGEGEEKDAVHAQTIRTEHFLSIMRPRSIELVVYNCCYSVLVGYRVWSEFRKDNSTMYSICWVGKVDDRVCVQFASHFYEYLGQEGKRRHYGSAFQNACVGMLELTAKNLKEEKRIGRELQKVRILWVEADIMGQMADEEFVHVTQNLQGAAVWRGQGSAGTVEMVDPEDCNSKFWGQETSIGEEGSEEGSSDCDSSDSGSDCSDSDCSVAIVRNWRPPGRKMAEDGVVKEVERANDLSALAGVCEKEMLKALDFNLMLDKVEIGTVLQSEDGTRETWHGITRTGMLSEAALQQLGVKSYLDLMGTKGRAAKRAKGAAIEKLKLAGESARKARELRASDAKKHTPKKACKKAVEGKLVCKNKCKKCQRYWAHEKMLKLVGETHDVVHKLMQQREAGSA